MRLSVQTRLLAAFGVVVALMLVVGLFAVARLHSDNQHLGRLAGTVVPSTRAVGDINALMNKYRKDQLHYIVARPADRPLSAPGSIAGDLRDDLAQMTILLRAYRSRGLVEDSADAGLFASFGRAFHRYVLLTAPSRQLADRGHRFGAAAVVGDGAGDRQWDVLKSVIAAWDNHKVETASAAAKASYESYRFGITLILALLAAAAAAAAAVAIAFARRTTRAVREIGAAAKAIAGGDIEQRVVVRSRDELGQMAEDFDSMITYLRCTVEVAESIASGDLDVDVRPRSQRDALGNALMVMTESLRRLASENEELLAASRAEAHSDALTGLANRRALMRDLESHLLECDGDDQLVLALFDLDGFKQYNDTFGHPAGDALLVRLGGRLQQALDSAASAYRMGGDEFCVLARVSGNTGAAILRQAATALSEQGEAFEIGCSYGSAILPREASTAEDGLRLADRRMYEVKASRASASRQSTDVLLKVLDERSPGLHKHLSAVAQLATLTAERFELPPHEVKRIELAAQLHDIGKVAIPDSILAKPASLTDEEWAFVKTHTEIGARIICAAPSLAHCAELVRCSHERPDGTGYPHGLVGDEIPLGASIIAVCDAFDAMIAKRPYSDSLPVAAAVAELNRCAGTQFHPDVVETFCALLSETAIPVVDAA